jgi:esterase/lipase superfamily enzyme
MATSLLAVMVLTGCASKPVDQVDLMPAPDVYGDGLLNPLPVDSPYENLPYRGILYATDRWPASTGDKEKYYLNDRGQVLRLGVAEVVLGDKEITWEKARKISLLKSRTEEYPIRVSNVDEWGVLKSSIPFFYNDVSDDQEQRLPNAESRYVEAINAQIARSENKNVYIYVHGYKVVFENPILVSSELWHFLGYDGVFIAYAWPSTPSKFAYIKDSDTSGGFSRNLRLLIEFIAKNTDAEHINILGYSNGTRLVTRAMEQLALIHHDKTQDEIHKELRLRNVILVGSDLDRGVFRSYVADGLLNVAEHLTVYLSDHDKALGVSQFLTRRERLGQLWGGAEGEMDPTLRQALIDNRDRISFINVSPAEGASVGNGHGYFRSSPWASSDVLMTLYYGLTPSERGLVDQDDLPIYTFPADYVARLWDAIEKTDPEFAEAYRALKARD